MLLLLAVLLCLRPSPAIAQSAPTVTDSGVDARFPDHLVFRANAQSAATIAKVRLRYAILPDGTAATGEAQFQPGNSVSASFALQSSDQTTLYLPPGTTIKYHWEVTDDAGASARTEEATYFHNDDRFQWTPIEQGGLTVYYYSGSEDQAGKMLSVGAEAIDAAEKLLRTQVSYPVKVWIYDNVDDMRPALPRTSPTFEQQIVLLGVRISSDTVLVLGDASFDTLRHELTHVVTHAAGESALGSLPAWLDEGTAVFSQQDKGGFQNAIERGIRDGEALSVRSITAAPGDPAKVELFYGEAWSLVSYLNDKYGAEKFGQLFAEIKKGKRIDAALQAVYGFDQDGLEDEWRAAHQLPPRVTPTPPAKEEASPEANGGGPGSSKSDGGTSTGTLVGVALGTLALAAAIGFAGMMLARRFR